MKIGKIFFGLCKNGHLHIGTQNKGLAFCNETGKSQRLFSAYILKRPPPWEKSNG